MNEILNQRIQAVQIGKDITYAQLIAKRNLREELETEMEKYLARGGQIKQAEQKPYEAKHGTNAQYTNMACRCKKCHAWALKAKKVKTREIRL